MENERKKYTFYKDEKVTTWMRTPFEIVADNQEDANNLAKKFVEDGETDLLGWEEIDGLSMEIMSVEENGGESTVEIRTMGEDVIHENGHNS